MQNFLELLELLKNRFQLRDRGTVREKEGERLTVMPPWAWEVAPLQGLAQVPRATAPSHWGVSKLMQKWGITRDRQSWCGSVVRGDTQETSEGREPGAELGELIDSWSKGRWGEKAFLGDWGESCWSHPELEDAPTAGIKCWQDLSEEFGGWEWTITQTICPGGNFMKSWKKLFLKG